MQPSDLPERVRELIRERGVSQAEFAESIGLDAPKLSKSLNGTRRFTSLEVALIAEQGGVTVDWLLSGSSPAPRGLAARSATGTADLTDDAVARVERFHTARHTLNLLGHARELPAMPAIDTGMRYIDQGTLLARHARQHLTTTGVEHLAETDLADAIEDAFATDVAIVHFPADFSGLAWHSPGIRLIAAATGILPTRQRFTLAHELGHVLAGDDQELHADVGFNSRKPSEIRANAFAASFLVPEHEVAARVHGTIDDDGFAELVMDFGVSPSTMAIRLSALGLIGDAEKHHWSRLTTAACAERAGRIDQQTGRVARSRQQRLPRRLVAEMRDAYLRGETSIRPFAALTGIDSASLRELLSTAPSADGERPEIPELRFTP